MNTPFTLLYQSLTIPRHALFSRGVLVAVSAEGEAVLPETVLFAGGFVPGEETGEGGEFEGEEVGVLCVWVLRAVLPEAGVGVRMGAEFEFEDVEGRC